MPQQVGKKQGRMQYAAPDHGGSMQPQTHRNMDNGMGGKSDDWACLPKHKQQGLLCSPARHPRQTPLPGNPSVSPPSKLWQHMLPTLLLLLQQQQLNVVQLWQLLRQPHQAACLRTRRTTWCSTSAAQQQLSSKPRGGGIKHAVSSWQGQPAS